MKKLFGIFCLCFMMLTGIKTYAQTTQIATLFHDGTVTNFRSSTALSQALEAAAEGDVITLSSGMFQACKINKNVTLRGAGMGYAQLGGTSAPTLISGDFTINCPESETQALYLEGLMVNDRLTIKKADKMTALKCEFRAIYYSVEKWDDLKFIHCIINDFPINVADECTLNIVNSVVKNFNLELKSGQIVQFENSVVYCKNYIEYTNLMNSVVFFQEDHTPADNGNVVRSSSSSNHSIFVGIRTFSGSGSGNKFVGLEKAGEVFASDGFYELAGEYKEFKGTDGNEVGIHGGSLPFSPVTTNLKISKFKVAECTTSDGKLPVEINIESN